MSAIRWRKDLTTLDDPTISRLRRGLRPGPLAAALLFLSLLTLWFTSLAPQAVAAEVQTNCPNRPTGDKRATGNQWDYELHNIYGVGCLDVMVSEVKKVSAAKASEGSSKLYAFRVTSKIAPGPWGRPHSQYFEYKVKLSGTAKQGEDYKFFKRISTHLPDGSNFLFDSSKQWALQGTPRGSVTAAFMFQILDDDEVEPDETVTFTISYLKPRGGASAEYQIGTASATFTIQSDDVAPTPQRPRISIAPKTSSITEGGNAVFTLTATPAPSSDLSVGVTVATAGEFGISAGKRTVTIPTTGSATLTLATTGDGTDEADGSVTATLNAGDSYTVTKKASSGKIAIQDDDVPPEPEVTIAAGSGVTEGASATFTLTATPAPTSPLTVSVTVAVDGDYGISAGKRTVTIPTTGSATLTLSTTGDAADEPDGSVTATVEDGTGYTVGSSASGTVSIQDDDVPPEPEVTIAAGSGVTEGASATFTLTATPAPTSPLTVSVTVAVDGDYGISAGKRTVTIPTTGSATLTLSTTGDAADEPDGSVTATVEDGTGYTVGSSASGTVSIQDDDVPPEPEVTIAASACVSDELKSTAVRLYKRNRWRPPDYAENWFSVLVAFGERTPDQWTVDGRTITPMTAASARQRGWRRFAAALECLEVPPTAVPVVSIAGGSAVTEGAGAGFTVSRTGDTSAPLTVLLVVSEDGTGGRDFVAPGEEGDKQVVIQAGSTQATYTVPTGDDTADEPDGTVTLVLRADNAYTSGSPSSATVAVRDDDDASPEPEVTIAAGSGVTEGASATFTLTATPAPTSPLTVSVTVAVDGDYGISAGKRTVTIPTTGSATLTLSTTGDAADEPDGSVTATVEDGTGYTVGSSASGTVSIQDDDVPPEPEVTIAAGSGVTEGASATFTLTATPAPTSPLTVSVTVAVDGDYGISAGKRTVTIPTTGSATLTLSTTGDAADEPDGSVTATVEDGTGYTVGSSASGTVSIQDDDVPLSEVTVSVEDATAHENEGLMWFTVRLSGKSDKWITVRYRTRESTPVSAQKNRDYLDTGWFKNYRWEVTFSPGQTKQRFYVWVFNDSHAEDPETFEVVLHSPSAGVSIADGVAVGTIVNSDPMPEAWLTRFGRTVAEQALGGIAGRMAAPRTPGAQGTIAGQAISFDPDRSGNGSGGSGDTGKALSGSGSQFGASGASLAEGFGDRAGGFGPGFAGHNGRFGADGLGNGQSRTMTVQEVLLGSSFTATGETDGAGGSLALWGRAAQGNFDGRKGAFSLDGETTTAMLGADYVRDNWLVGLALMQSAGEGGYADTDPRPYAASRALPQICADPNKTTPEERQKVCDRAVREGNGSVEASLTAAVPYAALQASERLKLWGALGYGTGEVTLKPQMGGSHKADIDWTMVALGLRGDVIAPPKEGSGPALAVTSDALWARTPSDKMRDLAASESDVTRLRLGLDGSYRVALKEGGSITPKLEVGARHDGGDAETGFGVELGGGIAWVDPVLGLSLDLSGRTLIAHGNDDLKDQGFAASLVWDPAPATKRGPSLTLHQDWGGRAEGGLDLLFTPAPLEDRTGNGEPTSRWAMEAAYGLPVLGGGRFTGSPHVGFGLATAARDYTIGWRLTPEATNAPDVSFGLEAVRRENDTARAEHIFGIQLTARW